LFEANLKQIFVCFYNSLLLMPQAGLTQYSERGSAVPDNRCSVSESVPTPPTLRRNIKRNSSNMEAALATSKNFFILYLSQTVRKLESATWVVTCDVQIGVEHTEGS
jgi:hypothetical protein